MEVITAPLNMWDRDSIRPGPVGSVGDTMIQVRLKQSAPDLDMRFDKTFSGANTVVAGANISDGSWYGLVSGGRVARTLQQPLGFRQGFRTAVGWVHEDIRAPDTTRQPKMGATPQWSWKNKVATVYKAKHRGDMFLPSPGGYYQNQTSLPRGSQIPRLAAQSNGNTYGSMLPSAAKPVVNPVTGEVTWTGGINGDVSQSSPSNAPGFGGRGGIVPGPAGAFCAPNTTGLQPYDNPRTPGPDIMPIGLDPTDEGGRRPRPSSGSRGSGSSGPTGRPGDTRNDDGSGLQISAFRRGQGPRPAGRRDDGVLGAGPTNNRNYGPLAPRLPTNRDRQ